MNRTSVNVAILIFIMVAWFGTGLAVGYRVWHTDQPVCHSTTEDSVILDCDYRDGGWYQR